MSNTALLKAAAGVSRPIVLTRAPNASIEAWLAAAEVVMEGGNPSVILLDQGVRASAGRLSLDLTTIATVRKQTHLPILVDPSYAAGQPGQIGPLAVAAVAVGAQGVVLHHTPLPMFQGDTPALETHAWTRVAGSIRDNRRRISAAS